MARVVVTEFVTLDGVFEDPGGSEGHERGGWAFQFERGEDGDKFKLDETMSSGGLLLGRRTFEEFAKHWPSREGEFAEKFNGLPKYVVSSTIEHPRWGNGTVLKGDVVDEVSRVKQDVDGEIVVYASYQLARTLIDNDLVDELRLVVFPVLLGGGQRLFGETGDQKPMRLVGTTTIGDGLTRLTYELGHAA
jgi:dihydrofolate reductase